MKDRFEAVIDGLFFKIQTNPPFPIFLLDPFSLKYKNPFGKKGKAVDMNTTGYFDQTTGRGKLNFEVLNKFPNFIEQVTEEGVDISQGSNPNEAIFTFPQGFGQ